MASLCHKLNGGDRLKEGLECACKGPSQERRDQWLMHTEKQACSVTVGPVWKGKSKFWNVWLLFQTERHLQNSWPCVWPWAPGNLGEAPALPALGPHPQGTEHLVQGFLTVRHEDAGCACWGGRGGLARPTSSSICPLLSLFLSCPWAAQLSPS